MSSDRPALYVPLAVPDRKIWTERVINPQTSDWEREVHTGVGEGRCIQWDESYLIKVKSYVPGGVGGSSTALTVGAGTAR